MKGLYILRNKLAVPVATVEEWGRFFQTENRIVAVEQIGGYTISTVFLGLDHSFGGELPILFETMIFGPDHDTVDMDRCGTWEEAIDMHERMVALVVAKISADAP
jgi:hypothetical protein